jgi:hypothetical protein
MNVIGPGFADEQRQLIDSASAVLDRPSAIKMVKSLFPPTLEQAFAALSDKIAEANLDESVDGDTTQEGVADSQANGEDKVQA